MQVASPSHFGRVQDPVIGRFLSADSFVPDPFDGQSFNRYSYVRNNPLTLVDPTGFCDDPNGCPYDLLPGPFMPGNRMFFFDTRFARYGDGSLSFNNSYLGGYIQLEPGRNFESMASDPKVDDYDQLVAQGEKAAAESVDVTSTVDRMSLEEYAEHTRQHIAELEALLAKGDGTTPSLRPDPPTTLDVAFDIAEGLSYVGGPGAWILKSLVRRGAGKFLFGQASVRSTFAHGPHAGLTIGEVAQGLRAGTISADSLPIDYVIRNGQAIVLNNRSLLALTRAGMQPTVTRNLTGNQAAEALLNSHLQGGVPSTVIRVRGGPPGTSLIE